MPRSSPVGRVTTNIADNRQIGEKSIQRNHPGNRRETAAPCYDLSQNEGYQVWQLIAPQSGREELRFELRHRDKAYELPQKIVTISVLVR
jgi:hypothetical protein